MNKSISTESRTGFIKQLRQIGFKDIESLLGRMDYSKIFNPDNKSKSVRKHNRFKPVKLDTLLRPHFVWYLRRYQLRILECSIITAIVISVLFLLIKNIR